MRVFVGVVLAAFALTGCGSETVDADADGDGEVSAAEVEAVVEATGADLKPQPGKYRSAISFVSAEIPGVPDELKEAMGANMNVSNEICITPEMAEKGFRESLEQGQNGDCTMNTYKTDGSRIDVAMTCVQEGIGEMKVAMNGDVSPTGSDLNVTWEGNVPPLGEARFILSMKQERIGDCDS